MSSGSDRAVHVGLHVYVRLCSVINKLLTQ